MWFTGKAPKRIFADAAAGTPLSLAARQELVRLLEVFGNAGGLHKEGQLAKAEMDKARDAVASAIGAHADEIIFTASGTEANNLGLVGILRPLLLKHGELSAITSAIEHSSVLEPLFALEEEGLNLVVLPVSGEGLVSPKVLKELINDQTVLVSVQLVNSEVGTIEPIQELAKVIRAVKKERDEAGLPLYFHTDASQAPLWLDIQVDKLGVDLLTLDAQKVLGPKGVGCLYVKRGTSIVSVIKGGSQEFGLRAGTQNTPLVGSFAVALTAAQQHIDTRVEKITTIREYCFEEIKKRIPTAVLNGPTVEYRVANNLNVSVPGLDAQMAVIALDVAGVAASTRSACDIGDEEPSHVIHALGIPKEMAGTAIRFTFLPDATKADAKAVAEALAKVSLKYRSNTR
jgi:cysteine desulfurase